MSNWIFNAPANLKDFSDPQVWHKAMVREANDIIKILVASATGKVVKDVTQTDIDQIAPLLAYVNPVVTQPAPTAETLAIAPWSGFPRAVERRAPWNFPTDPDDLSGIFRAAEETGNEDVGDITFFDKEGKVLELPVRHRQDEYLEWAVRRNQEGKITRIIFVAEGYDYFSTLFKHDEKLVTEIYRDFTGVSSIMPDDLRAIKGVFVKDDNGLKEWIEPEAFNPRNKFNINPGVVHLSHNANSLGAEVNLAGVSGVARKGVDGKTLPTGDPELLLCCSQGGNPNRNSDPLIGEQAYAQVLQKFRYTLADPVGLYIAGIDEARMTTPAGETIPREWWKIIRGRDLWVPGNSRVLRLELEAPKEAGFVVGDLLVDGNEIKFPGQIAQLVSVHLFVTRWQREQDSAGVVLNCEGTCCRMTGTQQLKLSAGACRPGFDLAFEGLVPVPGLAAEKEEGLAFSAGKKTTRFPNKRSRL
jgi:hypothetical protein